MILKLRRRIFTWKIWLGFTSLVLCWIYWDLYVRYSWNIENDQLDRTQLSIPANQKIILLWTTFFYDNYVEAWQILPTTLDKCHHKCHFTVDKTLFPISDAVVYHGFAEGHNLISRNQYMYPLPMPKHRRPEQIWIYYMLEPPLPKYLYEIYDTLEDHYSFNWTMTYRRDSDIFLPYGKFKPLMDDEPVNKTLVDMSQKTGLIAGMISECHRESGREGYIEELRKFIPIYIYGKCGNLHCSRKENCYEKLGKQYKFWLSFENSLCPEYLTEKFYRPMFYGMIPVYYGHPDAPALRAPSGSYINTNDFETPEALAKHLIFLDENPTEYLKYFEWRKSYRVLIEDSDIYWVAWCDVCNKLHDPPSSKSYRRVSDWFLRNNTDKSICLKPSYHV